MQLTRDQQEQVRQAKERGERRVNLQFTDEQRKTWREAVEQELAAKQENTVHIRRIMTAAEQPGFFGDVRRAILVSRRSLDELAAAIGVEARVLADFRAGEAELPVAALDRLMETLGLRLMQEIPR
jgi:ribosome-binding protein aMBF1 (putative translation factor)